MPELPAGSEHWHIQRNLFEKMEARHTPTGLIVRIYPKDPRHAVTNKPPDMSPYLRRKLTSEARQIFNYWLETWMAKDTAAANKMVDDSYRELKEHYDSEEDNGRWRS